MEATTKIETWKGEMHEEALNKDKVFDSIHDHNHMIMNKY